MNDATCKACLDNPNIPAGQERPANRQLHGAWLCEECDDRITCMDNGTERLRRLMELPGPVSLLPLMEDRDG